MSKETDYDLRGSGKGGGRVVSEGTKTRGQNVARKGQIAKERLGGVERKGQGQGNK